MFFEFDGVGLNRVTDPPNANTVTYEGRLLLLPTGQVLYAAGTSAIYVYTPTGYPDPAWRPTITNCPSSLLIGHTYTLQGTQLNGLSQAASYGDDAQLRDGLVLDLAPMRRISLDADAGVEIDGGNHCFQAICQQRLALAPSPSRAGAPGSRLPLRMPP